MKLSKKVCKAVIETLAAGQDLSPLELGLRLKNCLKKRLAWESFAGEPAKDFVFRISGNGALERLPLIDFTGRKLVFTYKKTKEKKSLKTEA